ncbi:protocadherin Fat 4-like [Ylistrum balloti]|uniref:protocadherin Fat 4-like n=1 Tax=Ylistrum balloti TaxID=509963 RepID=UPI002905F25B|nr:protocadherin Fat 4-like [Ylistrum balloti]
MELTLLLKVVLIMIPLPANGADCAAGDYAGDNTPKTRSSSDFSTNGMSLLTEDTVPCTCGVVYEWLYYAKSVNTVYFQIWRGTGTAGEYELVGQHQHTPTATGSNTATFTSTDRISVNENDIIGWYSPGASVVSYKSNGGGPDYRTSTSVGALTVGNTHDWSGDALQTGKRFGFQAKLQPGSTPTITNLVASTSISDISAAGFLVYTLTVYDDDGDTITTSMTSSSTEFSFDTNTLEVTTLINTIAAGTYTLTFQVQDPCGKTSTGTLTITVENSPLYITNLPSYAVVSQDLTAVTLLHSLTISDVSPTDSIASCTLTSAPKFTISIVSGTTYGIYSISNPGFDYTTTKKYQFDTTCTDSYGSSDSGTFYVYITSNTPPTFSNLPATTTIPSSTLGGTSVYTVTASDVDISDAISFSSITCSSGGTCPFTITAAGEIQTNADLTSLTIPGYDLYVTISDGTNTVGPRTLTVKISGINSPPVIQSTPLTFSLSLMENSARGASVYQINAADPDLDTLTYSAVITPAGEGATVFSFDTSSGLLSTSSSTTVDYESLTSTSFTVDVTVTDNTLTDTYSTFTVNVVNINEPPVFGSTTYYVSGNEGNDGESFGNPGFVVTDPDTSATQSYSVDCTAIAMDSSTGAVTLSGSYDLDISGTASVLTCIATVSDGELTDTAQLIVTINDVNDHSPAFGQSYYTIYTTIYGTIGETIGSIAATDGDLGIFGALSYTLDQASLNDTYFGVSGTGNVYLNKLLTSFGDGTYFAFTATVTDYGGLTDTANVVVVVYMTTTAPTTTTTEQYITFFEYPPNIVWFTVFWLTAVFTTAVFGYLIYKHEFLRQLTCEDFKSVFREKKKRSIKRKHRKTKRKQLASGHRERGGVTFASPSMATHINTKL